MSLIPVTIVAAVVSRYTVKIISSIVYKSKFKKNTYLGFKTRLRLEPLPSALVSSIPTLVVVVDVVVVVVVVVVVANFLWW